MLQPHNEVIRLVRLGLGNLSNRKCMAIPMIEVAVPALALELERRRFLQSFCTYWQHDSYVTQMLLQGGSVSDQMSYNVSTV